MHRFALIAALLAPAPALAAGPLNLARGTAELGGPAVRVAGRDAVIDGVARGPGVLAGRDLGQRTLRAEEPGHQVVARGRPRFGRAQRLLPEVVVLHERPLGHAVLDPLQVMVEEREPPLGLHAGRRVAGEGHRSDDEGARVEQAPVARGQEDHLLFVDTSTPSLNIDACSILTGRIDAGVSKH